ncbi:hypothetical protein QF000_000189 [Paraburkholderia atlantica]|uniref:Transposase DDE domain-containing protein n=1 Tax=Paraburkholderia youngii TaxID=2782701 RepID=A0A7W8P7I7_9BURK|nr:hypothetical protein [Paraburkholderia youngii]
MAFGPTLDAIPAVSGLNGHPRKRPGKLHADKGNDFARCRRYLKQRGITARIARRGVESKERLGRHRWVVERTHAWFAGFGKLRIRFERRHDIHSALLSLAAAVIRSRVISIPANRTADDANREAMTMTKRICLLHYVILRPPFH